MPPATKAGPAINQFEVKDLDSSPGEFEFQSQNAYSTGQPRRRTIETAPGDFAFDGNTVIRQREALELQVGITEWFRIRIGIEYEQERLDDPGGVASAEAFGDLQLDELALEGVLVFVKPQQNGVGLGLLVEYGAPMSEAGAQDELYVGPIIQANAGPWTLIANLAFVKHMGGKPEPGELDFVRDEKWDFSYFVQNTYRLSESFALALEAYGTFDRLGSTGTRDDEALLFGDFNQHRMGPVAYYTFFPGRSDGLAARADALADGNDDDKELAVSIGAGALFGLNGNTPDTTYKLSLEVEY